jgi:hypothetical protein
MLKASTMTAWIRSGLAGAMMATAFFWVAPLPALAQKAPLPTDIQDIPALNADLSQLTVSGLSSGAFMAHQLHVAFSDRIQGAGIISGGPFDCSGGSSCQAVRACMNNAADPALGAPMPGTEALYAKATELADAGRIASLENLKRSRVYLAHGSNDAVVADAQADGVAAFYARAGLDPDQIHVACRPGEPCHDAGHAMVAPTGPGDCSANAAPYLSHCETASGQEQSEPDELLKFFYADKLGGWKPPSTTLTGDLIKFSQDDATTVSAETYLLASAGYIYIPKACRTKRCPLHVAFHGCVQSEDVLQVNDDAANRMLAAGQPPQDNSFVRDAGYNPSADANGIIVLYPQAQPSGYRIDPQPIPAALGASLTALFKATLCSNPDGSTYADLVGFGSNPDGCWDWFGYSRQAGAGDDDLWLTRDAPQMKAVMEMVDKLGQSPP